MTLPLKIIWCPLELDIVLVAKHFNNGAIIKKLVFYNIWFMIPLIEFTIETIIYNFLCLRTCFICIYRLPIQPVYTPCQFNQLFKSVPSVWMINYVQLFQIRRTRPPSLGIIPTEKPQSLRYIHKIG